MNKDTDIQFLINEYNNLIKNAEIKEKYKEARTKLIGKIVWLSKVEFDRCEDVLEDNPEIIIGLMKNISDAKEITNDYLDKLKEYNNHTNKIISVNTRIGMILKQITNKDFDRCITAYHNDEELFHEILKYIDKLEKKMER